MHFSPSKPHEIGAATPQPTASPEPELVRIACYTASELESASLVLTAVGITHTCEEDSSTVLIPGQEAPNALSHLEAYRKENVNWPPEPVSPSPGEQTRPPTVFTIMLLALFFAYTGPWQENSQWFMKGAIDSQAIVDLGQWWRLVSALTLHADLVHLAGNCLIGGFVIHLLCKLIGYGTGWLVLLLDGAAGNALNILIREESHHSVGLSTSVFAAVGIFTGLQFFRTGWQSWKSLILPLGAGAGLLAFLGSEGVRTDLGAHFFGFLSGLVSGVILNQTDLPGKVADLVLQRSLFAFAMMLVFGAWLLAWQ